jgi:hypothetical protein
MTKAEQYKAVRLNGSETAEALDREAKHIGNRRRRTNFLPSTTLEEIFEIVIQAASSISASSSAVFLTMHF